LRIVLCWLTESQELDEKKWPIIWTEWPTGEVMGGWFTLASKVGLSCQGPCHETPEDEFHSA